jgi:hypothetical protein
MIITDFHPDMLLKGATRSFNYDKKVFLIRNYIHLLLKIESLASKMNWRKENLTVMRVDEKIKQFYEKSGALEVYNETFNMPIIYGIHFKKQLS